MLNKMTDGFGLGDSYGATIERIMAQDGDKSRLGMGALMWISHAERPLRADVLCHALALELSSRDFNASNIPSISTLVGSCQGLITVDKEASTVRLVHFTLQEYLSGHPDIFSRPHSAMAEICLAYLNSEQVGALSGDPSPDIRNMPFLEYCSIYWGVHAKRELSDCARSLALELLQEYDDHISTKFIFEQLGYIIRRDFGNKLQFSGLHRASFSGITRVVTDLIELGCYNINEKDILGFTPLAWAAHNGHDEIVRILLEYEEVNSDEPANTGQSPLSLASQNGHEGVVRILLGREEVNPEKQDSEWRTPLSHAAGSGREGVVKILLGRQEVNPDKPDNRGQTPLMFATRHRHQKVIALLQPHKAIPQNTFEA